MVQEWAGDTPRHPLYTERYAPNRDDIRHFDLPDPHRRQRPMEIADTLNTYCGIPGELYFLAVRGHDGGVTTFFSPGRLSHDDAESSFFDAEKFQQIARQPDPNGQTVPTVGFNAMSNFYGRPMNETQSRSIERRHLAQSSGDDWDGSSASARKRQRARQYSREDDQEETMSVNPRRGLKIGDDRAVYSFYEQRFKACQQSACKLMAKAWVKVLAPKKQSTHPYTGSDEKAPDWWPKPWGPTKEDRVRHKEPDHLYKRERVHLLIHMLRKAMEPPKMKSADLQKLGINVKKLEDATHEALSGWLAESEANASKRAHIDDIFRVAKMEERCKDGMLDETSEVFVALDDSGSTGQTSENDEMRNARDEDEAMSPTRASRVSQVMREDRPSMATGGSLLGNLPMRTATFPPQQGQLLDYMPTHPQHQFDDGSLPPHTQPAVNASIPVEMVPHPASGDRRGSLFSNFNPPAGSVFSTQWQQVSTGANTNQGYAYAAQQAHPDPQAYTSASAVPLPSNEHQGYLANSFDAMPRAPYDPSGLFRQPQIAPGAAGAHSQGYAYATQDVSGIRGPEHSMNHGPSHRHHD